MSTIALDHIVILAPPKFLTSPPVWLTTPFTIIPGGRHSNNLTFNKLILFQDGVYIELIAFVEGTSLQDREATRWGRRREGSVVDFAFTLLAQEDEGGFDAEGVFRDGVQKRVREGRTGFEYLDPVAGGRVTPEGTELKWAVAVPRTVGSGIDSGFGADGKIREGNGEGYASGRLVEGELPFWCLDRTPRDLRVPFRTRPEAARHASGAVGVAGVDLYVKGAEALGSLKAAYEPFLGEGSSDSADVVGSKASWELQVPERHPSRLSSTLTLQGWKEARPEDKQTDGNEEPARISLKLFTTGSSGLVSGEIAPGRLLEIELIHIQT